MTLVEVRSQLVDALRLDLVGPDATRSLGMPDEILLQSPSRWYLTGFLVPLEGDESQRSDETSTEELDGAGDAKGADDAVPPEPTAARRAFFPSSMGVSILVPRPARKFAITVRWGDYGQSSVGNGRSSVVSGQLSGGHGRGRRRFGCRAWDRWEAADRRLAASATGRAGGDCVAGWRAGYWRGGRSR